ncbi:hypothetical protein FRC17_002970 [Serendipita sp. 399]|nr:hypothetical protein FRC17_002970 [Serendipita sp. 399]
MTSIDSDTAFKPDLRHVYSLLERLAPFPTWSTLVLAGGNQAGLAQLQLGRMGGFTNLEALYMVDMGSPLIFTLSNTVTSSLKTMEYLPSTFPGNGRAFTIIFAKILPHLTTSLLLPDKFIGPTTGLDIPANITSLQHFGDAVPDAHFPHIRSLTVRITNSSSLPSLATNFPNLRYLALLAKDRSSLITPFPPIELPNLESLTTYLLGYTLLSSLVTPKLQSLSIHMLCGTLIPSWKPAEKIEPKDLVDPSPYIGSNISPQKIFYFCIPVSIATLKATLHSSMTKISKLVVFLCSEDSRTVLSTLFRSVEGYLEERTGGEPEFWEYCPQLESILLLFPCRLTARRGADWDQFVDRFRASRSLGVHALRSVEVMWGCQTKRKIVI